MLPWDAKKRPATAERFGTGLTGLEPATSGVTDRHSNQAELQPQRQPTNIEGGSETYNLSNNGKVE